MPYNEALAARIRESLSHLPKVEEKEMFRGVCFMVNGKMCVCVGHDEMMCRIDPEKFDSLIEGAGCRAMIRNGKALRGFIFVGEEGWKSKKDFTNWINLCLEFNDRAKATKKKNAGTIKNRVSKKVNKASKRSKKK
jgi:TfoX/Sxy family transcriptional regulator of competence genes